MPKKKKQEESYKFFIQNLRPEEKTRDTLKYFNKERVKNYANSKSLMRIQEKITYRALNIAQTDLPARVLDLGMGCGFASRYMWLKGYQTVGIDINNLFLTYYDISDLHPINADIRNFSLRPNSFDLIISISAVQWLLAEKNPKNRSKNFRNLAYICSSVLKPNGKAIMQFYPKSDDAMKEFGKYFADTGKFNGHFVIDNPDNPKKRRIYLYLEKME